MHPPGWATWRIFLTDTNGLATMAVRQATFTSQTHLYNTNPYLIRCLDEPTTCISLKRVRHSIGSRCLFRGCLPQSQSSQRHKTKSSSEQSVYAEHSYHLAINSAANQNGRFKPSDHLLRHCRPRWCGSNSPLLCQGLCRLQCFFMLCIRSQDLTRQHRDMGA